MQTKLLPSLVVIAAALLALSPVAAQDLRPAGYYVQGGGGEDRTYNATVGLTWPWLWRRDLMGIELGGLTEAYVSHWSAVGPDGRRGFTQVGLVPMLRLRLDRGSPWFAEAGIGISAMDKRFVTSTKELSTSLNFVDVVGVGRSFGTVRPQELGLRIQHVSNAGIKSPNPGHNFVMLRYSASF